MTSSFLITAERWLAAFLPIAVLVQLQVSGMMWRFLPFGLMLASGIVRDVVLATLQPNTELYNILWTCSLIPFLVFCAWAAMSASTTLLTGLGFSKPAVFLLYAMGFMAISALITESMVQSPYFDAFPAMTKFGLSTDMSVNFLLGITLASVALLSKFRASPTEFPVLELRHSYLLAAFFVSYAVVQFLSDINLSKNSELFDSVAFTITDLLYIGWLLLFKGHRQDRRGSMHLRNSIGLF